MLCEILLTVPRSRITPANNFIPFLTGEPAGGAGAAGQPDRRAALRHGQAVLGARAGHGMSESKGA